MKKIVITAVTVLLLGTAANAQNNRDCNAILRDYFAVSGHNPETYPPDKAEYRCQFSANSFYLTDDAPDGYIIFQFAELTNLLTGAHPAPVTTLDLNTFSYYTYNFDHFQGLDPRRTIYFDLDGNGRHFLAVRRYEEALDRTANPQNYKD
ncbi:MAG: hypothetical protein J6W95_02440 [Bacteroidales bacterium]|nr:hypothetical protein [Bacteroidales bacterium]